MRSLALCCVLPVLATGIAGCISVTQLRDPKSGQTVTCGGEIWNFNSHTTDQHCLDYWQKMGYLQVQ